MVFKSDKQRKGFFGSRGNVRGNVNPTIKDITGRKLKVKIIMQKGKFLVKDSQNKTIASGKTKASAIKRAKFILTS